VPIGRGLVFDGLSLPERRSRLQRAARDQLSSGIGRRWFRGLLLRSAQVPEMLDQATPREGVCEFVRSSLNGAQANRVEGQNDSPRQARYSGIRFA
jgi:hypothetical protein